MNLLFLVLLKVLSLLKTLFVDFVAVDRRVAVLCEQDDQIRFQFGFDRRARF